MFNGLVFKFKLNPIDLLLRTSEGMGIGRYIGQRTLEGRLMRATEIPRPYPLKTLRWMTLATASLLGLLSLFGPEAQAATQKNTVIEAVQLPAWVERDGRRQPAHPGQALAINDKAVTAESSRMLLRLPDRSTIKLGEKTEFQIAAFSVQKHGTAGPSHLTSALRLISGVFRYATDYTSKALGNTRDIKLQLATATVGIRGTDFWSMTDASHDAVCLFEGHVVVTRDSNELASLQSPGAFWITRTGQPEQPAGVATPEQLMKFIGQAEFQPGSGVLLEGGRWRAVAALLPSAKDAASLRTRLQVAGYPAEIRTKQNRYEVRINDFATEADAQTVLERLRADPEMKVTAGRVALAAE